MSDVQKFKTYIIHRHRKHSETATYIFHSASVF